MLIAQLSDLHVRPSGTLYKEVANSNQDLADAIAHLEGLDRRPELVLLTGDLVDEGLPEEYRAVREILSRLTIPFLVLPGNHDHRENFRAAFRDHAYLPESGPVHYSIDGYPVRIIALDSCVPGLHHGALETEDLAWLARTLADAPQTPTIVMLHHPPFRCGIPYMDLYRLLDPAALEEAIRCAPQVVAVVCGHVHRTMVRRFGGTVACSAPSTTTQIALRLAPDAQPASYLAPRGCLLHLWSEANGLITHVSHIGEVPGPYPFA